MRSEATLCSGSYERLSAEGTLPQLIQHLCLAEFCFAQCVRQIVRSLCIVLDDIVAISELHGSPQLCNHHAFSIDLDFTQKVSCALRSFPFFLQDFLSGCIAGLEADLVRIR
jgi:hypothetical protein